MSTLGHALVYGAHIKQGADTEKHRLKKTAQVQASFLTKMTTTTLKPIFVVCFVVFLELCCFRFVLFTQESWESMGQLFK